MDEKTPDTVFACFSSLGIPYSGLPKGRPGFDDQVLRGWKKDVDKISNRLFGIEEDGKRDASARRALKDLLKRHGLKIWSASAKCAKLTPGKNPFYKRELRYPIDADREVLRPR